MSLLNIRNSSLTVVNVVIYQEVVLDWSDSEEEEEKD